MNFHRLIISCLLILLANMSLSGQSETQNLSTSCPFTVVAAISHPSCPGGEDGFVELVINNAIPPVSVEWLELTDNQTSDTDAAFLKAGVHQASVMDGTGCIDTIFVELNNPPELVTVSLFKENIRCFGESNGSIDLEPNKPEKVRAYYINGQEMPFPLNTIRPRFRDLQPGNYVIAIEDINGCFQEDYAEITEPEKIEVETDKTQTTCPDGEDGSLSISVTGGVGGYEYSLDGVDYQASGNFDQLAPREYQLYVRDANGCAKSRNFIITAPPEPRVNFEKEDVTCPGGEDAKFIVIIETVGLDPAADYEYSLDGDNYQQENVFENLKAGIYDVYSKSPKSCVTIETVIVEEPAVPEIHFESQEVTCPDGNDASFIVIIETVGLQADDEYEYSIDGFNYQTDSLFENLRAGVYELSARNQNLCISTALIEILEPKEPVLNFEKEDVTCPGGKDASFIVIIETVGLEEDYEYSLDDFNYQADSLFENLSAGTYTAYARNPSLCVSSLVVVISEPDLPSFQFSKTDISCHGASNGVLSIQANGSSIYHYSLNGQTYQEENLFEGLEEGKYTINIQDDQGCTFVDSLEITQPKALINEITKGLASCGYANGWMANTSSGGTTPYQYLWNTGAQTAVIAGLLGGAYQLTVTDQNGCQQIDSLYLVNQDGPLLKATSNDISCHGADNGQIDLDIESYGAISEIIWSNGARTEDLQNLAAGNYAVTVIDENHCSNSEQIIIKEPQELYAKGQVEKVGNTGAISLEVSGGTQPYFYSWSTGTKAAAVQDLPPGDYIVTITDENQCTMKKVFKLLPVQRPMADNLQVYPVPTTTDVSLKFDLAKTESIKIEVLDELGRLLIGMPEVPVLHDLITLDLDAVPGGVYYIRIYLAGEVLVKKVIKVIE